MFEQYSQQTNNVFMENALIQKIEGDNQWTISNKDKKPVDAKYLLETFTVRNARVLDDPYPLVTLTRLNNEPKLQATNRAYRLHAQMNNVIVVDVEPSGSDELLQFAIDFPAHYTEISRRGGVHLLIEVPDDLLTAENSYLFTTTVVKSGDGHFEVIMNDHFITFTKRIVLDKRIPDFNHNADDRARLTAFLNNIVEMDKEAKIERDLKRQEATNFDDSDIDKETIEKVLNSIPFVQFGERQSIKTPDSFGGDLSRYEASISTACAGFVYRFKYKTLPTTQVLRHTFEHLTENDWIYAVFKMLEFIVPERDKHNEKRDGLPWLMYLSETAWTFIKAKEKQAEEEKRNAKKNKKN